MSINQSGWRPEMTARDGAAGQTFTGNRALQMEEPLIFETGRLEASGVDLERPARVTSRLGKFERKGSIGLPGLSEPEAMRHYVRLSQKNYGIDTGLFPLGSCRTWLADLFRFRGLFIA